MSRSVTRAFVALGLVLSWLVPAHADHVHSVTGPLTVARATDKKSGKTTVQYRVGDTPVTFLASPPSVRTGALVEVHGEADGAGGLTAAAGSDVTVITAPSGGVSASGPQSTAVLVVNLKDKAATLSVAKARDFVFGASNSVDALYREASFGRVSFTGDVFGPFTIAIDSATTDEWQWAYQADDAARAAGVDLSKYARRVYVLPDTRLGHSGLGTIGGAPSRAWIYDDDAATFAHELGHNLGLQHASTPSAEYGDASCPMGNPSGLVHPNGPHKVELGWVPSANVQTVTTSGTYSVANLEESQAQVQVLRIAKPDTGETYWVSYRHATGYDGQNLSWRYRERTSVHRFVPGEKSFHLAALADGESFQDSVNAITVTQTAHDALHATISVTFGARALAPSLTLASGSGPAGAATSLAVTLRDEDAAGTPTATFTLAADVPSGWTVIVSPSSLVLAAGAQGTATLRVTPPLNAAPGSFFVALRASDSTQPAHAASATAIFTITAPPAIEKAARVTATTLNVRDGPMGTILGSAASGHVFVKTGKEDQGFAEVFWAGRRAWVSASYLEATSAAGGRVTSATLNVRAGPSTSDTVLAQIHSGDVYADAPGGTTTWRAIQWDGQKTAYVSRDYTKDVTLGP